MSLSAAHALIVAYAQRGCQATGRALASFSIHGVGSAPVKGFLACLARLVSVMTPCGSKTTSRASKMS